MARVRHSTEYYDYINTCYECKRCGAKEYVKGVYTVVGWRSETSAGYDSNGKYHAAEKQVRDKNIYISSDGYYHRAFDNGRGWCRACIARRRKRIAAVTAIVIAVILALSLINTVLVSFINGNSGVYEWTYRQVLKKYEGHAAYQADVETDLPGQQILEAIEAQSREKDFYMHFYEQGSGAVQKYTDRGKTVYFYSFGEGWGELSDTLYIHTDGLLYVDGDEKIAYRATAAEYGVLLEKLSAYLPQSYCATGDYITEGRLSSDEDALYAVIAYGEDETVLYDSGNGYYFEKTPERFARLHFGEDDRMAKLPVLADYTVIE